MRRLITDALAAAPEAARWARRYTSAARHVDVTQRTFLRQTAPHILSCAVQGLAEACVPDAPARLVGLLRECIADTAALTAPPQLPLSPQTVASSSRPGVVV